MSSQLYQNEIASAPIAAAEPGDASAITQSIIATLQGTTAWYVTVILSETIAFLLIGLALGVLTNLTALLRVGLAVAYFLLLITTCFLSMFTRDAAREQRISVLGNQMINLKLRLGLAGTFFGLSVLIFVLVVAIPTEYTESFERVGLSALAVLLVLCTFLLTKTIQDRKEAKFFSGRRLR